MNAAFEAENPSIKKECFLVEASQEGDDLGAIGAAALDMQKQFNFIEQTI